MKKLSVLFAVAVAVTFISCKKEAVVKPVEQVISNATLAPSYDVVLKTRHYTGVLKSRH